MPARKYADKCNNGHPNNYTTTAGGNTYCLDCSRQKSRKMWERDDKILYMTWNSMRRRCNNPNAQNYYLYGGRGIKVCKRWNSYENFKTDMGERPSPQHSIERIDHEADYSPTNCRWADRWEQASNKRNNRYIEYNGERKTLSQWARYAGIEVRTLFARLNVQGWTMEQALTIKPVVGSNQTLLNPVKTPKETTSDPDFGPEDFPEGW